MSEGNRYILSVIDHVIRFVILIAIQNKQATAIVRNLVERVFSVFEPPETLHSDWGREFENDLVKRVAESLRIQENSYRGLSSPRKFGP